VQKRIAGLIGFRSFCSCIKGGKSQLILAAKPKFTRKSAISLEQTFSFSNSNIQLRRSAQTVVGNEIMIFKKLLIPTFFALLFSNCSSSSDQIKRIDKVNKSLYTEFNFIPSGSIKFQMYHNYGMSEEVSHLITITKPTLIPNFENSLPLDSLILKKLNKINDQKFQKADFIHYAIDYYLNEDITNEVILYQSDSSLKVGIKNGSYQLTQDGKVEIFRLYDFETGYEYIELKK